MQKPIIKHDAQKETQPAPTINVGFSTPHASAPEIIQNLQTAQSQHAERSATSKAEKPNEKEGHVNVKPPAHLVKIGAEALEAKAREMCIKGLVEYIQQEGIVGEKGEARSLNSFLEQIEPNVQTNLKRMAKMPEERVSGSYNEMLKAKMSTPAIQLFLQKIYDVEKAESIELAQVYKAQVEYEYYHAAVRLGGRNEPLYKKEEAASHKFHTLGNALLERLEEKYKHDTDELKKHKNLYKQLDRHMPGEPKREKGGAHSIGKEDALEKSLAQFANGYTPSIQYAGEAQSLPMNAKVMPQILV